MGDVPFSPAITGPIENPRGFRLETIADLFDEKTRERLQRIAGALHFSADDLIREATLRYLDQLEHPGVNGKAGDGDVGGHLR